jgi:thiamine pyrophosphokinase
MKTCFIFGAGDFDKATIMPKKEDYVIAADGGWRYVSQLGIVPDLVMGDFDSLTFIPQHPNVEVFPSEKDDPDMGLAIKKGLALGYERFLIYGGLGGRLDHTLANLQLLQMLSVEGKQGYLLGNGNAITAVTNGTFYIPSGHRGIFSVFALAGEARNVTITGMKYNIQGRTFYPTVPLGVSNELVGQPGSVSVGDGTLVLLFPEECLQE